MDKAPRLAVIADANQSYVLGHPRFRLDVEIDASAQMVKIPRFDPIDYLVCRRHPNVNALEAASLNIGDPQAPSYEKVPRHPDSVLISVSSFTPDW